MHFDASIAKGLNPHSKCKGHIMTLVGQRIENFTCDAVVKNQIKKISLADFASSYKLLFFYPLDFTFVCPTELHALQEHADAFKQRNTTVFGISVDSVHSHMAWLSQPKAHGGILGIEYPLISDLTRSLSQKFGVLNSDLGIAYRGVFLLDQNNIVQYASVHNLGLGRNIHELIRVVDALQHHEQHGEVCPANWAPGTKAMKPTTAGVREYFG